MLVARMEGFKYMSRFLGTPTFQYAVVPLADVQNPTSRYHSTLVTASALVPLMGPDGSSRAAVFVPFPREHASYVELTSLPERPGQLQQFPVTGDADTETVRSFLGTSIGSIVPHNMPTSIVPYNDKAMTSKLDGRLWVQEKAAKI